MPRDPQPPPTGTLTEQAATYPSLQEYFSTPGVEYPSQSALARAVGVRPSVICRLCKDYGDWQRRIPNRALAWQIAKLTGVPFAVVLWGQGWVDQRQRREGEGR